MGSPAMTDAHSTTTPSFDNRLRRDDYRLSVLWQIAIPVWQAANSIPSGIWWHHLERIFLGIDDLGCRDFLTA